jgi:hypothetical protein
MREDMDKVIVERPRVGSRLASRKKGYRKYVQNTDADDLPRREPMLGHWRGRQKWLNEHLGPMRRFLRSQVGRPWNKVHHDLCEHVSFDNAVQKHVLTHVFDFVQRHVDIRNGKVIRRGGWRNDIELQPGDMYVCPESGLLKVVRRNPGTSPRRLIQLDPFVQFHHRDGQWWEVRLRKPPDDPSELWDAWFERPVARISEPELRRAFGGKLIAVSKRLLSRSEARELHRRLRKSRLR